MRILNDSLKFSILKYVYEVQKQSGESPCFREIMEHFKLTNKATVSRYLKALQTEGMLDFEEDGKIAIPDNLKGQGINFVPIVGTVACGLPVDAVENIEDNIALPVSIFGTQKRFILKAKGTSMTNAGVEEGDLVVVKQQSSADNGEIVVAMTEEGEATIKRLYKEGKKIRLHPESEDMKEDIILDKCDILGVATHVIKALK